MTRLRRAEIKKIHLRRSITVVMALLIGGPVVAASQKIGDPPEASNMRLVGFNDLQARSAYQPTIHRQGGSLDRLYWTPRRNGCRSQTDQSIDRPARI
jgi:hypothetical protein